jgi:hypothetical protein
METQDEDDRVWSAKRGWQLGGHHCITGRTFCTSSALLTLLAEKSPAPVAVNSADPAVKGKEIVSE